MNPEFTRNKWLELSSTRIIITPIILFLIFFVIYIHTDIIPNLEVTKWKAVANAAYGIIPLFLIVWGSGLAADAIFKEISDRTWDAQRMTPTSPFSMTIGKLFGSTIFVWYASFICVFALLLSKLLINPNDILITLLKTINILLLGLCMQTLALFSALLVQRINPNRSRVKVTLIQLSVIFIGLALFSSDNFLLDNLNPGTGVWFGKKIGFDYSTFETLSILTLFGIIGIYRLLRVELKLPTYSGFVLVFILYCTFHIFSILYDAQKPEVLQSMHEGMPFYHYPLTNLQTFFFILFVISIAITFISAFFTPKNIINLKVYLTALRERNFTKAYLYIPAWILPLCLVFVSGIIALFLIQYKTPYNSSMRYGMTGFILACCFFLIRDIGILYYNTLNKRAKRSHLATLVYLAILYTIVPTLFSWLPYKNQIWMGMWLPFTWLNPIMAESYDFSLEKVIIVLSLLLLQVILVWTAVTVKYFKKN